MKRTENGGKLDATTFSQLFSGNRRAKVWANKGGGARARGGLRKTEEFEVNLPLR